MQILKATTLVFALGLGGTHALAQAGYGDSPYSHRGPNTAYHSGRFME
jgi:hypothetical protein